MNNLKTDTDFFGFLVIFSCFNLHLQCPRIICTECNNRSHLKASRSHHVTFSQWWTLLSYTLKSKWRKLLERKRAANTLENCRFFLVFTSLKVLVGSLHTQEYITSLLEMIGKNIFI